MPVLVPLATAAIGAIGTYAASRKTGAAESALEAFNNKEGANSSILDFYNKALNKYSANPYTSNIYNAQKRNIERSTAQGIAALQDRRSGVAGVASLVQRQNDALLNAAGAAEQQQGQALSQLGNATAMKAGEQRRIFENKYNLLAQKAAQAATRQNMNQQSMYNSLGNAASIAYGEGKQGNYGFGNLFSNSRNGGAGNYLNTYNSSNYLQASPYYSNNNTWG